MLSQNIPLRILSIFSLTLFFMTPPLSSDAATSHARTYHQLTVTKSGQPHVVRYMVSLPPNYVSSNFKWPMILFLHGAGERGDDLQRVAKHGPPKLASDGIIDLPFIVVAPQCPKDAWWNDRDQLEILSQLITETETNYRVDKRRIYLTGLSMGGYGTWHLAAMEPDRFAAIAPICGGGNPQDAERIKNIPTWVFHGARDKVVPISKSDEMVQAVRAAGGKPNFTIYREAGHDSWTESYANRDLYQWFLKQQLPND